jgi:CRISPR-associated protein Cmr1
MPREIPDVPKGWKPPQPGSGRSYEIELITPMFGGGVETRVNDPSFPIRPTSIRGQLQFWWRATVGAQYATRQELRAAQSAVWGDTTRASRVQVRVELLNADPPSPCARFVRDHKDNSRYRSMPSWNAPFNNTALPYALFPFQGQLANGRRQIEVEPASSIRNAKFRLTVICHKDIDFAKQVEPALWAWVNFGGLGGRTRRGCGAIKGLEGEFDSKGKLIRTIKDFSPKDAADLAEMWKHYMPSPSPQREWPILAEAISTGHAHSTDNNRTAAIYAWDQVIGLFKHYRQGEGLGRNEGQQPNRPGRSRYPEPEAIRTVLYNPQAPWPHNRMEHIPNDAFPRAELGLPIVFHFQGQGEPSDTVLYPDNDSEGKKRERMASPLILKPLAFQSGKAVPLILRLKTPALTGVDLRRGDTSLSLPPTTVIRDPRLSGYPNSPLAGSPNGSAIEAFMAFARTEGFTEVTR